MTLLLTSKEWIPDLNGNFRKPSELSSETIDKNFYKNVKGRWLILFDFAQEKTKIEALEKLSDEAGINPGVLGSGEIDLSAVSSNFYKQYKAALALVPCDATALRVFTTDEIDGKEYTIGVIFVYDASVEALKNWLE